MLSQLQKKKLARYFRVYDVNDSGRIAADDFERVVENVRILHGLDDGSPRFQELRAGFMQRWEALRKSADADADGGVDLDEWFSYWDAALEADDRFEEEVMSTTERLFRIFDTDEDGELGPDEFCDFHGIFGLSAAQARRIFIELDADGDGAISHEELVQIGRDFYRSEDPDAPGNLLFGPYE